MQEREGEERASRRRKRGRESLSVRNGRIEIVMRERVRSNRGRKREGGKRKR